MNPKETGPGELRAAGFCRFAHGPGGAIGFAVSAVMSPKLTAAARKVEGRAWQTFKVEEDGTLRQWADS